MKNSELLEKFIFYFFQEFFDSKEEIFILIGPTGTRLLWLEV